MKTARTDSATKTRLLEASTRVMLAKDYSATSIDEICSAAKVTEKQRFGYPPAYPVVLRDGPHHCQPGN